MLDAEIGKCICTQNIRVDPPRLASEVTYSAYERHQNISLQLPRGGTFAMHAACLLPSPP